MSQATATLDLGARVLRHLSVGPEQALLDVSAGREALTIAAARTGADVTAIDASLTMIELLNERARAEGLEIATHVMDATDLAFDDDTFHIVTSLHEMLMVSDAAPGLAEMIRVARPGGQIQMVILGETEQTGFRAFLESAGLSEVRVIGEQVARDGGARTEVTIGIGTKA